jgi:cell division protein YceG involved in septum cleavage
MILRHTLIQTIISFVIILTIAATIGIVLLFQSKQHIISYAEKKVAEAEAPTPFPVSVDVASKTIVNNPTVATYYTDGLAVAPRKKDNWWNQIAAIFGSEDWYQNLASPVGRVVVIWPGERKEEVTKHIGDILGWDTSERTEFQRLVDSSTPTSTEGKYFPGQYIAHRGATPSDIEQLLGTAFRSEVLNRYTPDVEAQVPLTDALIIASLLEREASDFENMREISGVIWNRLFINMPLQLDATLQYVKGSSPSQSRWWPVVRPADKYLASPFNTYENVGLPPAPIANPSAEAILAALNPVVTDCLFYFHAKNADYQCSPTYEDHVAKLRAIYGRGS